MHSRIGFSHCLLAFQPVNASVLWSKWQSGGVGSCIPQDRTPISIPYCLVGMLQPMADIDEALECASPHNRCNFWNLHLVCLLSGYRKWNGPGRSCLGIVNWDWLSSTVFVHLCSLFHLWAAIVLAILRNLSRTQGVHETRYSIADDFSLGMVVLWIVHSACRNFRSH